MRFASIAHEKLEAGGGSGLQFRGDEVLAIFTSARRAIRSAIELQDAFVQASIGDPSFALPVGIGLDAGEGVEVDDGYRGGALNLAARLCSIAAAGEILASESVIHLARHIDGVAQVDRGTARLKGLADPVRLTSVSKEGWDPTKDLEFQQAIGLRGGRGEVEFAVCPYRGLAAFQPEDADRFFGRSELVAELVGRMDREQVLFVVGSSGSGKSSVVRAGLIPAIGAGALPTSGRWAVSLFSPRTAPCEELWYQLRRIALSLDIPAPHIDDPSARAGIAEVRSLADAIADASGGLVVVIDQFEELFTSSSRRDQEAFVQMLEGIVNPSARTTRVVIVMRADFYGACATFPWLAKRATANQALVGPMSRSELRKVIEEPAWAAGLQLEDGLVDSVLEDAGHDAAALPLISHAMAETWRRRDGLVLTTDGYASAGGVAGSISQTADSLFETVFTDPEQQACRRLMLRLVTPGEGTPDTRRRLAMSELDRDADPSTSRRVAAEMVDARLLTVDRDSIEIAHEALLQSWPRLRGWIDEGRDDLRTRQRIATVASEWKAQGKDPDLLYRGTPLQASLEWASTYDGTLGSDDEEFLVASREAAEERDRRAGETVNRRRRVRRVAVSLLAILAVAAGAASVIAFFALDASRTRYAQSLATQARLLAASDPRTSIALAAEAGARVGIDPVDARAALVDASQALAAPFVPSGPAFPVGDASTVVVAPDGSTVVTGNLDGSISTWSATGEALDTGVPGHGAAIEEMDVTPDGRWLVSGSDDATVMLWDLADPAHVPEPTLLGTTTGIVWSVAVSPDGSLAASASEDGTIRLWDLNTQRQFAGVFADLELDALTVAFSPDGQTLAAGDGAGEITAWSIDDGKVVIPPFAAHHSDVWEIEFDRTGSRIVTASSDGRVRVWDARTLGMIGEPFERSAYDVRGAIMLGDDVVAGDEQGRLLVAPVDGTERPTISAAGTAQVLDASWGGGTLATLGQDQRLQLWSKGEEPSARVLQVGADGAFGLAGSPDGSLLGVGDGEGNLSVYAVSTGERELGPVTLHEGAIRDLAFSPDGSSIATAGDDGAVIVVDATSGAPIEVPIGSGAEVDALLWDGEVLVTGDVDGAVRLWRGADLEGELVPSSGGMSAVRDMALSPDGTLAVADAAGLVRMWDLSAREEQGPALAADTNTIWSVAWSPDGTTLATASDNPVVTLWDVGTRMATVTLTPQPGGSRGVAFLGDDASIVTTTLSGSVRLWDVRDGVPLGGELLGHEDTVWRSVPLPGLRFATSSEDGTVRIWDVLNGDRACERARGALGLDALRPYLGDDEAPTACSGA
jgi:WD40 repeat protein